MSLYILIYEKNGMSLAEYIQAEDEAAAQIACDVCLDGRPTISNPKLFGPLQEVVTDG